MNINIAEKLQINYKIQFPIDLLNKMKYIKYVKKIKIILNDE